MTPFEEFIVKNGWQILTLAVLVGVHLTTQKSILSHIKELKEALATRVTKEMFETKIEQLEKECKENKDALGEIHRRLVFRGLRTLDKENE